MSDTDNAPRRKLSILVPDLPWERDQKLKSELERHARIDPSPGIRKGMDSPENGLQSVESDNDGRNQ